MGRHIIIYDAVNAGIDWNDDLVTRCVGEDGKTPVAQAVIIGKIGTKLTMNEGIAELVSHNFIDMIVTDPTVDLAIFIGNYVYQGFKTGIFPNGSEVHVVTNSKEVVAAVKMAVILALECLKGHITFFIDYVVLQDNTDKICYSMPEIILGYMGNTD